MLFTLLASLKLEHYAWDAIEMKRMLCNLIILLLQTQLELDDGVLSQLDNDCNFLNTSFQNKKKKNRNAESQYEGPWATFESPIFCVHAKSQYSSRWQRVVL